jgi:hypothetical protein
MVSSMVPKAPRPMRMKARKPTCCSDSACLTKFCKASNTFASE